MLIKLLKKIIDTKKEIAVLDLGTNTICAAIAKGDTKMHETMTGDFNNEIRVLGVGYQLAKGIKKGTITSLEDLEDSIIGAISSAEKEAQKSIKSVFVALPSWALQSQALENSMDVGQLPIDEVHLNAILNFDTTKYIGNSRSVIHIFPVSYSLDGTSGIKEPLGMVGNELSAVFHVVTASTSLLNNIKTCLSRNNINVIGFIASNYASALSVTLDEEAAAGVIIIDIGGANTSVAYIKDDVLLYQGNIPVGGQHITNDIAMVLRTTKSNAERLKILYGISEKSNGDESILVTKIDEFGEEHMQNISKGMLDIIVSARLEELLTLTEKHIFQSGINNLCQRIVITGGGSRISGLNEFIKSKGLFKDFSIRLGKPIGTTGSHDFVKSASFASAAGSIIYCLTDLFNKSLSTANRSFWQKLLIWFKRGV